MLNLSLPEAQLLRMLSGVFGKERVIPQMSVLCVCGGKLPDDYPSNGFDLRSWAKKNKCLFTIVDENDNPTVVFEFFSGFDGVIQNAEVEHQKYLKPLLDHVGIRYVTISDSEFDEILDPESSLDFISFLKDCFDVVD